MAEFPSFCSDAVISLSHLLVTIHGAVWHHAALFTGGECTAENSCIFNTPFVLETEFFITATYSSAFTTTMTTPVLLDAHGHANLTNSGQVSLTDSEKSIPKDEEAQGTYVGTATATELSFGSDDETLRTK